MTDASFDEGTLARLRDLREVTIETQGARGTEHRAIIWVVVDESERVLIRSWRGPGARWYREASAAGRASLAFERTRIPVRVEPARDAARIEACSRALLAKYGGGSTARSMVRDEILETTLELRPA
jgi:hypothetical protein